MSHPIRDVLVPCLLTFEKSAHVSPSQRDGDESADRVDHCAPTRPLTTHSLLA